MSRPKVLYLCKMILTGAVFTILLGVGAGWKLQTTPSVVRRQSSGSSLLDQYPQQNFTMPVDHFHNESRYEPHTNATFQQLYWIDTSNYVPGGPVIVHAMGEDSPSYDLQWVQKGLLHQIANATGGVAVLWGQRYYSGGYDIVHDQNYTTENLRFHSTEQAIADLAYFSQRAVFSGLENRNLTAPGTPWIVLGGSYAGTISAFARIQYPDLFWGGLTSSGITTALLDDWQNFDVIRRYGPPACVAAHQQLINLFDNVYASGNETALSQFKAAVNVSQATPYPDIASLLTSNLGPWERTWTSDAYPFTGPGSYCDVVTNQTTLYPSLATSTLKATVEALLPFANRTATPNITSLYFPLLNLLSFSATNNQYCAGQTVVQCLSLDVPYPFPFLQCTEYGQFDTGYVPGSEGHPHALPMASRYLTVDYYLAQCQATYNKNPVLDRFNKYGGFNLSYPRLAISTGQLDWFRTVGPLAEYLPGGAGPYDRPNPRVKSNGTTDQPQIIIQGGYHEWDFPGVFANESITVPKVVTDAKSREVEAVKAWLVEWNATHHH